MLPLHDEHCTYCGSATHWRPDCPKIAEDMGAKKSPIQLEFSKKRHSGFVKKGWGQELIFSTNDLYCGKLLCFNKGAKFSMHFHAIKDETWHVLEGFFIVKIINTKDASVSEKPLSVGDTLRIAPLVPHQIICVEEGKIIEVSTPDSIEDNYRVMVGDSQSKKGA
jgi:mannose-6-phosphate isomerase-like protein (cupin superfamily)